MTPTHASCGKECDEMVDLVESSVMAAVQLP